MESSLHACTPARCAWSQTSTLLGNAPAGTLPNTLAAPTRYAFTLISSLFVEGISSVLDQRSGIKALYSVLRDLSSPNAKRLTLRPTLMRCARRSNYNIRESISLATLRYSSIHAALQADLGPIHEKAPCGTKLIYPPSGLLNPQIWLSGAVNGIPCLLLHMSHPAIHNYQLSINSLDLWAFPIVESTGPSCTTTHTISKKLLPCSNLAPTLLDLALLDSCPNECQSWVEKEKMTIFSLFNLTKQNHILLSLSREFTTLTSSARYGMPFGWLSLVLTHSLPAASLQPVVNGSGAEQVTRARLDTLATLSLLVSFPWSRCPVSKPGIFKYMMPSSSYPLNCLPGLWQAASLLSHFVTSESEVQHG